MTNDTLNIPAEVLEWIQSLTESQRETFIITLAGGDFDLLFPKRKRHIQEASAEEEWRNWAAKDPMVSQLDGNIAFISWLLWKHAGVEPSGKKGAWAAAVSDLFEAAIGVEHPSRLVEEAIKEGHRARLADDITLKGPRSFIGFVKNIKSKKEMAIREKQPALFDLDKERHERVSVDL